MEKILIRGPGRLKEALKGEAERLGITLNALILIILRDWLDRHQ